MTTAFSSVCAVRSRTRLRIVRSPTPKYVRYAALTTCGRRTTSTERRCGSTVTFSKPGSLTTSGVLDGAPSKLKVTGEPQRRSLEVVLRPHVVKAADRSE